MVVLRRRRPVPVAGGRGRRDARLRRAASVGVGAGRLVPVVHGAEAAEGGKRGAAAAAAAPADRLAGRAAGLGVVVGDGQRRRRVQSWGRQEMIV